MGPETPVSTKICAQRSFMLSFEFPLALSPNCCLMLHPFYVFFLPQPSNPVNFIGVLIYFSKFHPIYR
jgi:hypothetical protein